MLKIQEVRSLLEIDTRDTINKYLKLFDLEKAKEINWRQFRRIIELQIYLGLKLGCNSKEDFPSLAQDKLNEMFISRGIDINQRLLLLQQKHEQETRNVSFTLVLNNE